MKIKNSRITIRASSGNPPGGDADLTIILYDNDAHIQFAEIFLTPEQFVAAMSRLEQVECEINIFGLENIGKLRVMQPIEFSLGVKSIVGIKEKELAQAILKDKCPEGWIPEGYFNSQNSFFNKDGEIWARTHIHKWVDIEEEE